MTIDEAIADNLRIAEGQDKCAEISVSEHAKERIKVCADEHRQLAEWLKDYKEAMRLLIIACADIHELLTDSELNTKNCKLCGKLPLCNESGTMCKGGGIWIHESAVLKLIGEEENGTQRGNDNS